MTTIFNIDLRLNDHSLKSTLVVEESNNENKVLLVLREESASSDRLELEVNLDDGSYKITYPINISVSAPTCIAGCGVASFAGPIFECWKKTRKSPNRKIDFVACLENKDVSIASNYIQCVIGCLFGTL